MDGASDKKIFYGWFIVASAFLIYAAGVGVLMNTISVFIKPVCADLGFTRAQFSLNTSIRNIVRMCALPFYGGLFKRFGVKKVMLVCGTGVLACNLAYSQMHSLTQFYIIAAVSGIFMVGITMMAVGVAINAWFKAKKGLALGIAYTGSAFSAAALVPVLNRIIESCGWRAGYITVSAVATALLIPAWLLMRDRPSDMGLVALGADMEDGVAAPPGGLMRSQALKTPSLWLLGAGTAFAGLATSAINPHITAYLTDIGYSGSYAAGIVSFVMVCMIAGKLILGEAFDLLGRKRGAVVAALAVIGSSLLLLFAKTPFVPVVFAVVFGLGYSTASVPPSYLTSSIFGELDYSAVFAIVNMIIQIGNAIGSPLSGAIYDMTGSYTLAWWLAAASGCMMLICLTAACSLADKRIKMESQPWSLQSDCVKG